MTKVLDLVKAHGSDGPERQRVRWRWRSWAGRWERDRLPRPDVLDALQHEVEEHDGIRRAFVFEQRDDPLALFIAAMAWGFGRHPRAPGRVARMLTPPGADPRPIIDDIVGSARSSAADGFTALFERRRGRLPGLGTAFGTKLLYFAAYVSGPSPRPLIYDQFVWRALESLDDAPSLPHPQRYVTSEQYLTYCGWAADTAHDASVEADVVEYVLFAEGRRFAEADGEPLPERRRQ